MEESPFFEEVRALGRIEAHRNSVKQGLDVRFGRETAEEFSPILEQISDSERLSALLRLAIRCRRVSEFRRALLADVPSA